MNVIPTGRFRPQASPLGCAASARHLDQPPHAEQASTVCGHALMGGCTLCSCRGFSGPAGVNSCYNCGHSYDAHGA